MNYESEKQTRKRRIDPQLRDRGWTVAPYDPARPLSWYQNCAIEEFPTANGPADYGLCVDSAILGVIEAKKITLGPQNVLTQAQRYSRGLVNSPMNFDGHRSPFLYSTNGEVIWFQDARHQLNRSRKVVQFHTPEALREMFARIFETDCNWLAQTPNDHPRLRPYTKFTASDSSAMTFTKTKSSIPTCCPLHT